MKVLFLFSLFNLYSWIKRGRISYISEINSTCALGICIRMLIKIINYKSLSARECSIRTSKGKLNLHSIHARCIYDPTSLFTHAGKIEKEIRKQTQTNFGEYSCFITKNLIGKLRHGNFWTVQLLANSFPYFTGQIICL